MVSARNSRISQEQEKKRQEENKIPAAFAFESKVHSNDPAGAYRNAKKPPQVLRKRTAESASISDRPKKRKMKRVVEEEDSSPSSSSSSSQAESEDEARSSRSE
jgi:hypothetical protein